LVQASEANPAVAADVDAVLAKAMAQGREQRYATAADMRKALHETDQATTVVHRGEAQTVLFPPPSTKVGSAPTQTVVGQNTVKTGETTVVRPINAGPGRRPLPMVLSAVALLVLACGVLGFYMWQKKDDRGAAQVTNVTTASPSPAVSPAVAEATATPDETDENKPDPDAEETATAPKPTPKKQERASRNEEEKPNPRRDEPRVRVEVPADEDAEPPNVPTPPNAAPGGVKVRRPQTRVLPGGVVMRVLPDGSQIITMRDGTRVYVTPDGKRTVVPPRDRPNRRPPAPIPSP
jgi:hypothetical protein